MTQPVSNTASSAEPLLRIDNIVKSFGKVVANKGVSFDVRPGEIHCLLGENGAGKTVLMSILYGMYQPDSGSITYKGKPLAIHSPKDAITHRIGMVHQHFMLVPTLTVAENIVLGQHKPWSVLNDMDQVAQRIRELGKELGFEVNPDALVESLSVGEQQRVEILKTMYHGADLLILDEPTAVLTPQETVQLLHLLRGLADRGLTVIFITHKLEEVMQVSDRVTVLRDGRVIDTVNTAETNPRALARMMVGRDVLMKLPRTAYNPGEPVLEVDGVTVMNERGQEVVHDLSFCVHEREIVGIAGVSGNGQTELALALAGLLPTCCGGIQLGGKVVEKLTPHDLGHMGMAHLPEDRIKMGIVLPFSVAENMILHEYNHPPYSRRGFLAFGAISQPRQGAGRQVRRADGRCGHGDPEPVGRQPAEGRRGARTPARPTLHAGQPAHPGHRHRRDRVRAPANPGPARSRLGHPAHLDRAGGAVRRQRPHPGDVRGPDRRRGPGRPEPHGGRRPDDGGQASKVNPHLSPNPSLERAASPDVARSVFSWPACLQACKA